MCEDKNFERALLDWERDLLSLLDEGPATEVLLLVYTLAN